MEFTQVITVFEERVSAKDWSVRKALVVGAARQGIALTRYLVSHGAWVILNDIRPESELAAVKTNLLDGTRSFPGTVQFSFGGHPLALLEQVDLVCISGGVPLDLPLVADAFQRGIPLSNDSQIFLESAPCPVIGITGSAGKTTTTTLVGRIAHQCERYRRVWVGGNIGSPLIAQVDEMSMQDLAVIELSSFQLELMQRSPQVAAILNITPNHLDRHRTMEAYTAAKSKILDYQDSTGFSVLGRDDPGAWSLSSAVKGQLLSFGLSELPPGQSGSYLQDGALYFSGRGEPGRWVMNEHEVTLRGQHNLLNVLAAIAIAAGSGIPLEAIPPAVTGFNGVPHRLEFVRQWNGADWYNDSIATAPERVIAAIHSFDEPLILLVGGRDKKLPWEDLARLVQRRVDHLVIFGEAAAKIQSAIEAAASDMQSSQSDRLRQTPLTVAVCPQLKDAVQQAAQVAEPGDVVLLSPGGTSFDEFHDFEERGECFARLVKELP
jgi:UDP-N-acetylmuramoylalanine--D-glutamate ligase